MAPIAGRIVAPASHRGREAGFTLIEVLIAVLILTVGLLALGGVQVAGMKATLDGYMRSQAAIAAQDMADRMRANLGGVDANAYANVTGTLPAVPPTCRQGTAACTTTDVANRDIYDWLTSLSSATQINLPGGTGRVACIDKDTSDADTCTNGSPHTITVMWDGRRNGATGTACNPSNPADLLCYKVTFQP